MTAPHVTLHRADSASQRWSYVALIALFIALAAAARWGIYDYNLRQAQQAYSKNFKNTVETQLTQPFYGISAQIDLQKWFSGGSQDIVGSANLVALNETISLTLLPQSTGSDCSSSSNINEYEVVLDAPGFTFEIIGDSVRSRQALLAPVCSVSKEAPPAAPPWRWNLTANQSGDHVITVLFEALDKNKQLVESRVINIPVSVPAPPESFSAYVGVGSGIVAILATLFKVWESLRGKPRRSRSHGKAKLP
jgi:hypothetical protein